MLYYKKIDIDYYNDVVNDSIEYLRTHKFDVYNRKIPASYNKLNLLEFKQHCPKLDLAFARYDLRCTFAVAFVMKTTKDVTIHIDDYAYGDARINIPLLNVQGTYTRFFSGGEFKQYTNPETNVRSRSIEKFTNLKYQDRVNIDCATVIRVNEPHDVVMPADSDTRITLSLGFDRDPVFLLD